MSLMFATPSLGVALCLIGCVPARVPEPLPDAAAPIAPVASATSGAPAASPAPATSSVAPATSSVAPVAASVGPKLNTAPPADHDADYTACDDLTLGPCKMSLSGVRMCRVNVAYLQ